MAGATLFAHWRPEWLIGIFAKDPAVVDVAVVFLRTISWNFVASGIVFTCSGMFQAMGNTVPSVISSSVRLVLFAIPAFWLSTQPGFRLQTLWYVSVAASTVAAALTVWLLHREAERRVVRGLAGGQRPAMATDPAAEGAAG